jgi:hypothetical protein
LSQACEGREGRLSARLDERRVAYQGDAFEPALAVAAGVELSAIERAFQSVIAYVTGHDDRVERARGQKSERLLLVSGAKRLDRKRVC